MTTRVRAVRQPFSTRRRLSTFWQHGDGLYRVLLIVASLLVLALVAAIGWQLWASSSLSRDAFGFGFLTSTRWDPAIDKAFGALPYIQGTVVTAAVALVLA